MAKLKTQKQIEEAKKSISAMDVDALSKYVDAQKPKTKLLLNLSTDAKRDIEGIARLKKTSTNAFIRQLIDDYLKTDEAQHYLKILVEIENVAAKANEPTKDE